MPLATPSEIKLFFCELVLFGTADGLVNRTGSVSGMYVCKIRSELFVKSPKFSDDLVLRHSLFLQNLRYKDQQHIRHADIANHQLES
jgi:hypothetical protein